MMRFKKTLSLALAAVMTFALAACGSEPEPSQPVVTNKVTDVYADKAYGHQLDMPREGDTVAIMHTSMGDISIRFFPEAAPKAVENFTTHAKNGYYNNLTFHRVIKDFMIQGGDPKGTGTGGENIWKTPGFEDEFDKKLLNLRGSLAMANSGPNTNGSQFFINQAKPTGKSGKEQKESTVKMITQKYEQMKNYYDASFTKAFPNVEAFMNGFEGISPNPNLTPDEVWDLYAKQGGNIHLDGAFRSSGGHTVFGQVYDGMDVVDKIAGVMTDQNGLPDEKVLIKSIEITEYKK